MVFSRSLYKKVTKSNAQFSFTVEFSEKNTSENNRPRKKNLPVKKKKTEKIHVEIFLSYCSDSHFCILGGGLFERKREKEHEAGWVGSQGASGRRWVGYVIKILKL